MFEAVPADEYNKRRTIAIRRGIQQGLHNENFELTPSMAAEPRHPAELPDPKLVKFQFQCSTVANGYILRRLLHQYPGLFISMHLQNWDPATKHQVAGGTGVDRLEEDVRRRQDGRESRTISSK